MAGLLSVALTAPSRADMVDANIDGLRGEARDNVALVLAEQGFDGKVQLTATVIQQRFELLQISLLRALEPYGYYRAELTATLEQRENGNWNARFAFREGERVEVAIVDVTIAGEGADHTNLVRARDDFPLEPGSPLSHPAYEAGKNELAVAAERSGFLESWFTDQRLIVDVERNSSEVHLALATGRRFRFGELLVEQEILNPRLFSHFIPFEQGEPFSYRPLLELQQRLLDSGYFSRVEVEPLPQLEGPLPPLDVPVRITLEPAKPQKFRFGLGYATDIGPRGTLGLELRRINPRGHRFTSELRIAEVEASGQAQYTIPYWRRPATDRLVFEAGYSDARPDTNQSQAAVIGASLDRVREPWKDVFSIRFRRDDFRIGPSDLGPATVEGRPLVGLSELLVFSGTRTRLRADDPIYPTRGSRLIFEASGGSDTLLSDTNFLYLRTSGKWILSAGRKMRFLSRSTLGALITDDLDALPPALRFFTGGDQTIRGFGYQDIGARTPSDVVIGGDALAQASVELERRIIGRWSMAVFADAGDAFERDHPPDLGELKVGTGLGLRWLSPIGLVRADVAAAVSEPGTPIRFHLSIGPDL